MTGVTPQAPIFSHPGRSRQPVLDGWVDDEIGAEGGLFMPEVSPIALERPTWRVVLPLKPFRDAKTRLSETWSEADRIALTRAMAADTLDAVAGCSRVGEVWVLAHGPEAVALADAHHATVHADTGDDLTSAVAGMATADVPVAILMADLPALRPEELTAALVAAEGVDRGLVADAAGTGTVLLTARAGVPLLPAYGPGSRAAHIEAGAHDLTALVDGTVLGLRRDVDTDYDIAAVEALGPGPQTDGVLSRRRRKPLL